MVIFGIYTVYYSDSKYVSNRVLPISMYIISLQDIMLIKEILLASFATSFLLLSTRMDLICLLLRKALRFYPVFFILDVDFL